MAYLVSLLFLVKGESNVITALLAWALLSVGDLSFAQFANSETFEVSKTGKDKTTLLAVFEEVKEIEKVKRYGTPVSFQIFEKRSKIEFLAYKMKWESPAGRGDSMTRIGGGGGFSSGRQYLKADKERLIYLVLLQERDVEVGDTLGPISFAETPLQWTYRNLLGAEVSVQALTEVKPLELSRAEFVQRLKKGEAWTLKRFTKRDCPKCFGDGKLNALQGNAAYPDCNGSGFTRVDCKVKW